MDTVSQVIEALREKGELFGEYEEATRALVDCDIDNMTDYITKRTQLAIKIDKIDEQLRDICKGTPNGELLADVIANRCAYSDTPHEWQSIFDAGQSVLGCVSRVMELENRALQQMKAIQAGLKVKIAENQNTPKIARYLSGMSEQSAASPLIVHKA